MRALAMILLAGIGLVSAQAQAFNYSVMTCTAERTADHPYKLVLKYTRQLRDLSTGEFTTTGAAYVDVTYQQSPTIIGKVSVAGNSTFKWDRLSDSVYDNHGTSTDGSVFATKQFAGSELKNTFKDQADVAKSLVFAFNNVFLYSFKIKVAGSGLDYLVLAASQFEHSPTSRFLVSGVKGQDDVPLLQFDAACSTEFVESL